jgi:hypothetical protein
MARFNDTIAALADYSSDPIGAGQNYIITNSTPEISGDSAHI